MMEKMDSLRAEVEDERATLDRVRREANLRAEQDRSNINALRDQVTRLTSKIDDMRYESFYGANFFFFLNGFLVNVIFIYRVKIEEEKERLEEEMEELRKERDCFAKDCEGLKVELSLSEDRFENVKAQLAETNQRLKES